MLKRTKTILSIAAVSTAAFAPIGLSLSNFEKETISKVDDKNTYEENNSLKIKKNEGLPVKYKTRVEFTDDVELIENGMDEPPESWTSAGERHTYERREIFNEEVRIFSPLDFGENYWKEIEKVNIDLDSIDLGQDGDIQLNQHYRYVNNTGGGDKEIVDPIYETPESTYSKNLSGNGFNFRSGHRIRNQYVVVNTFLSNTTRNSEYTFDFLNPTIDGKANLKINIQNRDYQEQMQALFNWSENKHVNNGDSGIKIKSLPIEIEGLTNAINFSEYKMNPYKISDDIFKEKGIITKDSMTYGELKELIRDNPGIPVPDKEYYEVLIKDEDGNNVNDGDFVDSQRVKVKIVSNGYDEIITGETDEVMIEIPYFDIESNIPDNIWGQENYLESTNIFDPGKREISLKTNQRARVKISDDTASSVVVDGNSITPNNGFFEFDMYQKNESEIETQEIIIKHYTSGKEYVVNSQIVEKPEEHIIEISGNEIEDNDLYVYENNGNMEMFDLLISENEMVDIVLDTEDSINQEVLVHQFDESINDWKNIAHMTEDEQDKRYRINMSGLYKVNTIDDFGNSYDEYIYLGTPQDNENVYKIQDHPKWNEFVELSNSKGVLESELDDMNYLEMSNHFSKMNSYEKLNNISIDSDSINSHLRENDIEIIQGITRVEDIQDIIEEFIFDQEDLSKDDVNIEFESSNVADLKNTIKLTATTDGSAIGEKDIEFQAVPTAYDLSMQEISGEEISSIINDLDIEIVEDLTKLDSLETQLRFIISNILDVDVSDIRLEFDEYASATSENDIKIIPTESNEKYFNTKTIRFKAIPTVRNLFYQEVDNTIISKAIEDTGVDVIEDVTKTREFDQIILESIANQLNTNELELEIEIDSNALLQENNLITVRAKENNKEFYGSFSFTFKHEPTIFNLENIEIDQNEFNDYLNSQKEITKTTTLSDVHSEMYDYFSHKLGLQKTDFTIEYNGEQLLIDNYEIKIVLTNNAKYYGELTFSSEYKMKTNVWPIIGLVGATLAALSLVRVMFTFTNHNLKKEKE